VVSTIRNKVIKKEKAIEATKTTTRGHEKKGEYEKEVFKNKRLLNPTHISLLKKNSQRLGQLEEEL